MLKHFQLFQLLLWSLCPPNLPPLLAAYLNPAGFATRWVANGNDVITAFREDAPELILLDLMLPGRDGLTLCREIRQTSEVPIVMGTARGGETDRLIGRERGAGVRWAPCLLRVGLEG